MKRSMLVLWLATLLTRSAYAVDITTCDEIVPASETGVLLTEQAGCSDGVVLAERAALQMNGHSILGANAGVFCLGRDVPSRAPVKYPALRSASSCIALSS